MANFLTYADATTLFTAVGNKFDALGGAYIAKGSTAFASLPATPAVAQLGYVYNVTNEFTTDARFVDGTGKKYPAGTNVVVVEIDGDPKTYKFDVLAGFIDTDAIDGRIDNTQGAIAAEFDDATAYSVGDVVIYDNALYKCTTDHAAGAWDSNDFTATTVDALVAAAAAQDPAGFTTEQVTALLALL